MLSMNRLPADLVCYILSYLSVETQKWLLLHKPLNAIVPRIKPMFQSVIFDNFIVPTHTLLYGQVQSGKTRKIMDYVVAFKPSIPKILLIQNSVSMLDQYSRILKHRNIPYTIINSKMANTPYHNESVLLTIHNKFRVNALKKYLKNNDVYRYNLILDESDRYLKLIKKESFFQAAKHVLHVTATPFPYERAFEVDGVCVIPPSSNYVGIHGVCIKEMHMSQDEAVNQSTIAFLHEPQGVMLMTCFNRVVLMRNKALSLSLKHPAVPVVVLSTHIHVYINGAISQIKTHLVSRVFDELKDYPHIILIANRLSNRGINYTDSTYTRTITHQLSNANTNYTSFIQKCRIFGNRSHPVNKPVLFCIIDERMPNFVNILKRRLDQLEERMTQKNITQGIDENPAKITVAWLKKKCKKHEIRNYSRLNKAGLIQLLADHEIPMPLHHCIVVS